MARHRRVGRVGLGRPVPASEATGPPSIYLALAKHQMELVDSFPPEVKRIVWEEGFGAGVAAWREWKISEGQRRRAR